MFLKNTTTPASWVDPNNSKHTSQSKAFVSVKDRTLNTEAFILSFGVKNSFPLPKVPKFIEFAKFLSKDINSLQLVMMNRTAASYKLRDG